MSSTSTTSTSSADVSVNTMATATPVDMYGIMNSFAINPTVIALIIIVVLIYVLFFFSLDPHSDVAPKLLPIGATAASAASGLTTKTMLIVIAAIVAVIVAYKMFYPIFSANVTASVDNLFSKTPQVDITVDQSGYKSAPVPEQRFKKQVFNIPGNTYVYEDAKAVCKAYGARLATYKEVENAYNKGAEWCNYGWSDGQMALYPTQQKTYDELQKKPGHEHDCGRPGINGGFIDNPAVKFGVNCYGNKPLITSQEAELMRTVPPYPETEKDKAFQHRVDYWKNRLTEILVSPFNHTLWNQMRIL